MNAMRMKMGVDGAKKEAAAKVSDLLPQEYVDILRGYLGTLYSKLDCATLPYTALKDLYKGKGWAFPISSKDFVNGGRLVKKFLEKGGEVSIYSAEEIQSLLLSGKINDGTLVLRVRHASEISDFSPYVRAGDFAIAEDGSLLTPEKGVDAYLTQHYLTVASSGSTLIHASSKAGKTVEQDVSDYFSSSLNKKSSYILVDLGFLLE